MNANLFMGKKQAGHILCSLVTVSGPRMEGSSRKTTSPAAMRRVAIRNL